MQALDGDETLLEAALREAGALALGLVGRVRSWHKHDGSVVTEADVAVDGLLKRRLLDTRPGYGWLSEETPDDGTRMARERFWIADPIDGTRSFAKGGDVWCIGAALIERGRPVLAGVFRPRAGDYFSARAGSGAKLNGSLIGVGPAKGLAGARIIGGRKALARFDGIVADTHTEVPLLLRLCRVASGDFDGAYSPGHKHDWDLAAGDLLVHEAGGAVTGLDGERYLYNRAETFQNGMVAGNAAVHRAMLGAGGI